MQEAIRAAQRALEVDEVPVGAVVVCEGKIIGRGFNRNIRDSDPTAHAELVALREAAAALGNHRLGGCDLDRKSTRLNSSHVEISYAVFCLKKKKKTTNKKDQTTTTKHTPHT